MGPTVPTALAPPSAASGDPLRTLAAGLGSAERAADDAAQRVVADPFSVDAAVDLLVAGRSYEATAAAFGAIAETQRSVIDLLA